MIANMTNIDQNNRQLSHKQKPYSMDVLIIRLISELYTEISKDVK